MIHGDNEANIFIFIRTPKNLTIICAFVHNLWRNSPQNFPVFPPPAMLCFHMRIMSAISVSSPRKYGHKSQKYEQNKHVYLPNIAQKTHRCAPCGFLGKMVTSAQEKMRSAHARHAQHDLFSGVLLFGILWSISWEFMTFVVLFVFMVHGPQILLKRRCVVRMRDMRNTIFSLVRNV